MPFAKNELIVDHFWSPVAHGRIRSLDTTAACAVPGVVALFTYHDLAHNLFGPIIKDEILLAEDVVTFIGQPIVVIAAETREAIRLAKAAIKIDIEKLEPVFTIDEAKRKKQFIGPIRHIARGDWKAAFANAEHILEGTWINGGQDHFYLESQAAIACPGEFDQLSVLSSTQNPSEVQEVIAHLLGLPINKVVVTTKRMGGAFGGKECQATHPAAMAALVAHKTKRPGAHRLQQRRRHVRHRRTPSVPERLQSRVHERRRDHGDGGRYLFRRRRVRRSVDCRHGTRDDARRQRLLHPERHRSMALFVVRIIRLTRPFADSAGRRASRRSRTSWRRSRTS